MKTYVLLMGKKLLWSIKLENSDLDTPVLNLKLPKEDFIHAASLRTVMVGS